MKELENAVGTEAYRLLQPQGVETLSSLRSRGKTETGRKELAHKIGLPTRRVKTWLQRADIYRVRGVGREYISLFEAAKICSVHDIASLTPQQLQTRLMKANKMRRIVRRTPSLTLLTQAVEHAAHLVSTE